MSYRFHCTPAKGKPHSFSVLGEPTGRAAAAKWSAPPPCPLHEGAKVVRNGTYGKGMAKQRQSYKCFPADGTKPHKFTPPLPRDHVHENGESCDHCDELRGVHRGETAVARRHSWSTRIVARGLEQLAAGATYAQVSQWALRVSGSKRTRRSPAQDEHDDAVLEGREDLEPFPLDDTGSGAPDEDSGADGSSGGDGLAASGVGVAVGTAGSGPARKRRKPSQASKRSRNSWHIAADWVEAFSEVIYAPVEEELRRQAISERARLDQLLADGLPLDRPQVILVDDVPVYGRDLDRNKRTRRDAGYFVLVLAELHWPNEADGGLLLGAAAPESKLRLVRVMAKSNTEAWRIVFDELGYAPDFIVADAGTGISAAIAAHFDPARTRFIPSLWHLTQVVEMALADTNGAITVGPGGKQLIEPLRDHMWQLSRASGVLDSTESWKKWWDELLAILAAHKLAADEIRAKRKRYEPSMADVLDAVAAHPEIPVSTGGLETLIARHVKPLLAMRRTSFGNLERTNLLFDLVVARAHGAFDNLGDVANRLRLDAERHEGWTVALRAISDPRPRRGSYSSLRDVTLLNSIAKQRGLQ